MTSDVRAPKTSKELATAVYDDFKRKAVDEAKKRAVAQHVDYETFKNMVLVAHLKPLHAPNAERANFNLPAWDFAADGSRVKQAVEHVALPATTPQAPPTTSGDFQRDWRRACPTPDDKYQYLKLCGPAGLRSVFKVEVTPDILKDILGVLDACWLSHAGAVQESQGGAGAVQEAMFVIHVLQALATAGRFGLTLKLLGNSYKDKVAALFSSLQHAVAAGQLAQELEGQGQDINTATSLEAQNMASRLCTLSEFDQLRATYGFANSP